MTENALASHDRDVPHSLGRPVEGLLLQVVAVAVLLLTLGLNLALVPADLVMMDQGDPVMMHQEDLATMHHREDLVTMFREGLVMMHREGQHMTHHLPELRRLPTDRFLLEATFLMGQQHPQQDQEVDMRPALEAGTMPVGDEQATLGWMYGSMGISLA